MVCTNQKHGWSVGGHPEAWFELRGLFGVHKATAVDHDAEVGMLQRLAAITREMGEEVSTGAEAKEAHSRRIEMPLDSLPTHELDSLRGICDRLFVRRGIIASGCSVFEQDAGDADRRKPFADLHPFMHSGEKYITAARRHDDTGAIWLCGLKDRERGLMNVRDCRLACLGPKKIFCGRGRRCHEPGRSFRPYLDLHRIRSLKSDGGKYED